MSGNKVDYVVCVPGNASSGIQWINLHRTMAELMRRGINHGLAHATSNNIYAVRNACIGNGEKRFRKNQIPFQDVYEDYKAIIWVDSDNIVSPEKLFKLIENLKYHEVDMVGAWYRQYSMGVVGPDNLSACGLWKVGEGYSKITAFKMGEIPLMPKNERGLIEVDYAGFGLMAVKKKVTDAIEYPWFKSWVIEWLQDIVDPETGKVIEKDVEMCDIMTDDAGFCFRAKEKGFRIFIDPQVWIAHERKIAV